MALVKVALLPKAANILYELLKERTPAQSISHKEMPTWAEHEDFVLSHPYAAWYLIFAPGPVGSVYLTDRREVGLAIFKEHQGRGCGERALAELQELHPGPLLANINPQNAESVAFFEAQGFHHIQNTYERE